MQIHQNSYKYIKSFKASKNATVVQRLMLPLDSICAHNGLCKHYQSMTNFEKGLLAIYGTITALTQCPESYMMYISVDRIYLCTKKNVFTL